MTLEDNHTPGNEMLQNAVSLYNSGLMIDEVAGRLHVPYSRIQQLFKRHNISIRPRLRMHTLSLLERQSILIEYQQGLTINQLATKYNVRNPTIQKSLRYLGVTEFRDDKYNIDEHYFEEIDSEEKAYWLGFIMADGCVTQNTSVLILGLQLRDIEHIRKFRASIKSDHNITVGKKKGWGDKYRDFAIIRICSKKIASDLERHGVVRQKTYCMTYPDSIKNNKFERHFIRGYFDGNGTIIARDIFHVAIQIAGRNDMIIPMQEHFIKHLKINRTILEPRNVISVIRYGGSINVFKVADYLYSDTTVFLNRKHERYLSLKQQIMNRYGLQNYKDFIGITMRETNKIMAQQDISGGRIKL